MRFSTIVPPRQRFTWRCTWRVRLRRLSMAFVVASDRWRRSDRPKPSTVTRLRALPARSWPPLGYVSVQAPRQVLQQTLGRLDVAVRVGAREDHLSPTAAVPQGDARDVPALMDLTPLHQRGAPECLGHGRVEGLRAIGCDHQQAPVGAQPAAAEIGQEPLTDRRVLRGPFPRGRAGVSRPFYRCRGRQRSSVHPRARHQSAAEHQVQRVERRRPPRIVSQLRLSLWRQSGD